MELILLAWQAGLKSVLELNESTVYLSCTELMKDIIDANKNEFESLRQNDVFEEVKAVGQQAVTSK